MYFAYGSNMNVPHLRDWLGRLGVEPEGVTDPRPATLHNFRLRTNYLSRTHSASACNIEPAEGAFVEGVVMTISPPALEAIKKKEGWPTNYVDWEVTVHVVGEEDPVSAITFVVHPDHRLDHNLPVTRRYRNLILTGAQDFGLSESYRQRLRRVLRPVSAGDKPLIRNATA